MVPREVRIFLRRSGNCSTFPKTILYVINNYDHADGGRCQPSY
jgi:hypothetical protein